MKKQYTFEYDNAATVVFEVDTKTFTEEMANTTLNFFDWEFDKDANPVDEVMKKYALEILKISVSNSYGVVSEIIDEFKQIEGFCRIDGSFGITLKSVVKYEFDEYNLECSIKNL